jgi:hypothetical protein
MQLHNFGWLRKYLSKHRPASLGVLPAAGSSLEVGSEAVVAT